MTPLIFNFIIYYFAKKKKDPIFKASFIYIYFIISVTFSFVFCFFFGVSFFFFFKYCIFEDLTSTQDF